MRYRKLTFGKYKGRYVVDVCAADPDYITWAVGNVYGFCIFGEEEKAYKDALEKKKAQKENKQE